MDRDDRGSLVEAAKEPLKLVKQRKNHFFFFYNIKHLEFVKLYLDTLISEFKMRL